MHKTYLIRLFLLIHCHVAVIGCQVEARYAYSNPKLEGSSSARVEEGKVFLKDMELWFLAWNRRGSGLMVFPIPFPLDVSDDPKPPFLITMEFKPTREGFSFDPGKMFLWGAMPRTIPSRLGTGSHTYKKSDSEISRIPPSSIRAIELPGNSSTVISLEFDIPPPEPEQTFFVDIEGLTLNGERYSVPRIRFEKNIWSGTMR